MSRGYDQLAWVDYPETLTPISAANLNRMENGIANLYSDRNKLESNIAYVEDEDTSSRHYDIDAYLMHNGVFYKVTEEINIGDTLNYGLDGNIAHVDISSQFSSTGCVELTQAQYDALPEDDKMADIIYLITDAPDKQLIELTQSQYDALSEDDKMADIIYLVTDAPYSPEAVGIAYDNTTSGLSATNVQSAVDEVNGRFEKFVFNSEVYLGDGTDHIYIPESQNPGYRLVAIGNGDWDNCPFKPLGFAHQSPSYVVFFSTTIAQNQPVRIDTFWYRIDN